MKGIPWCYMCIGLHPDEYPTKKVVFERLKEPEKHFVSQVKKYKDKKHIYINSACLLCGSSYNQYGDYDDSWKITSWKVRKEFELAGINLQDHEVEQIVAQCRRSAKALFENCKDKQGKLRWSFDKMEDMSFAGHLNVILSSAIHAKEQKNKVDYSWNLR